MKTNIAILTMATMAICSCQERVDEELSQENNQTVSITASIGKQTIVARYAQENSTVKASFESGDKLGVFMDDEEVTLWTYASVSWSSATALYWPDRDGEHTFCAYYPYSGTTGETKDNVAMPSLEGQTGEWGDNIFQRDFLAASKTLTYATENGNVSFTGDNSFRHVSTLLKFNLLNVNDLVGATIDGLTLTGNGITAQTHYSFTSGLVTPDATTSVNTISITPSQAMGEDVSYCFILNGTEIDETNTVGLTINYTSSSGTAYTVGRDNFLSELLPGTIYEFNIQVMSGAVNITGNEITDWNTGNSVETIIMSPQ